MRHAQAASTGDNPELTPDGVVQAGKLAGRLSADPPASILHSGYRRAEQTAKILGRTLTVETERSDLADDLTPTPTSADRDSYPVRLSPWFESVPPIERDPGGERIDQAWTSLLRLSGAAGPSGILVVTHAFVIGRMVQAALSLGPSRWIDFASDNTGLTTIKQRDDGSLALVRFNDTGHLS